jgi:hypothetical protein
MPVVNELAQLASIRICRYSQTPLRVVNSLHFLQSGSADMKEIIVAASIMVSGLLLWIYLHREKPLRFRKRTVLTGGELEFFFHLRSALPECVVCTQVAVPALLKPTGIWPMRSKALERIDGKRVGYAVFDEDMHLLAVVEYNHRSRIKRRDAARDAWFASAGIRTVRFHARQLPSEGHIRSRIFAHADTKPHSRYVDYRLDRDIEYMPLKTPWRNTVNANR